MDDCQYVPLKNILYSHETTSIVYGVFPNTGRQEHKFTSTLDPIPEEITGCSVLWDWVCYLFCIKNDIVA